MSKQYCLDCTKHGECTEICPELEEHLASICSGSRETKLSADYMDKVFAKTAAEWLGNRLHEKLDERSKHVRKTIRFFGKCKTPVLAAQFFWIWNATISEGMNQEEIAYILGITQGRVSQILRQIRDMGEQDTNKT